MMERILAVTGVVAAVLVVLVGVRVSARLGAIHEDMEAEAKLLKEAVGGGKTPASGSSELLASLEKTAAALEALVADSKPDSPAGTRGITTQSMEDAALMLTYSPDPNLRQHTIAILGQLGGQKAEERLLEMMESDRNTQSMVLQALRAMGSPKLEPLVMGILQEGSLQQKSVAAGMLSEVLNRANVNVVLDMLNELPLGNHSYANSVRQQIYGALRNLGDPKACRPLMEAALLETQEYTQREAVQAMIGCSTPAELGLLVEMLRNLGPVGSNSSANSHQQLLSHLGQLGDPRATPALMEHLDSPNRSVTQQTVQALAQLQDPYAAERLVEVANGPDSHAKQYLSHYINNGYPGVRRNDDGTYSLEKGEVMERLMKARERTVARLVRRYGKLEVPGEAEAGDDKGAGENDDPEAEVDAEVKPVEVKPAEEEVQEALIEEL